MKIQKKTVITFSILVVIGFSSFIPAVMGWGGRRRNVTFRPITDWTDVNPFGTGPEWWVGYAGGNGEDNLWMFMDSLMGHFFYFDFDTFEPLTEYVYEFDGYVKEKLLKDGTLEYTVKLTVEEMYVELYDPLYDENGNPIWFMNYFGDIGDMLAYVYVDYYFELKFTLEPEYEGFTGTIIPQALWPYEFDIPAGTREPGCDLPPSWAFYFFPEELGIQIKSLKLIGYGSGHTVEPDWVYPDPFPADTGDTDLFFYFNAKFKSGEHMTDWPHGPFGFKMNYMTLLNTVYY